MLCPAKLSQRTIHIHFRRTVIFQLELNFKKSISFESKFKFSISKSDNHKFGC